MGECGVDRLQFTVSVILALLALFVACGGDAGSDALPEDPAPSASLLAAPTTAPERITEAATIVPSPTPGKEWTSTPSSPPATPQPSSFPTPYPTPNVEEQEARDLLEMALKNMRGGALAFDIEMLLKVGNDSSVGEESTVNGTFAGEFIIGDFLNTPIYGSGEIVLELPSETRRWEAKYVNWRSYTRGSSGEDWVETDWQKTYFPIPTSFLTDSSEFARGVIKVADVSVEESENEDGVSIKILRGETSSIDLGLGAGDFTITYSMVKDSGLLLGATVRGSVNSPSEGFLTTKVPGDITHLIVKARFYDYTSPADEPLSARIQTPELPNLLFGHEAFLLTDGRVLVPGGYSGIANNNVISPWPVSNAYVLDPGTGLWFIVTPSDDAPPLSIFSHPVGLGDGRIVSVEPLNPNPEVVYESERIEDAELVWVVRAFNEDTNAWQPVVESDGTPRLFPVVASLNDGRILIVGGVDARSSDPLSSLYGKPEGVMFAEIIDPETGHATNAAPNSEPIFSDTHISVVLKDGRVLLVGPVDAELSKGSHGANLYDPVSDTWSSIGDWNILEMLSGLVLLNDGRVLVSGVGSVLSRYFDYIVPVSEVFDPDTNKWTLTKFMVEPRQGHSLTVLPDGRVLAAGGDEFFESIAVQAGKGTTEIFDPASNAWTQGPDLEEPRSAHSATLLPDGSVLLAGGITLNQEIDEIYPTFTTEYIHP